MSKIEHVFVPIATMTAREDGGWDLRIDWSSSYSETVDEHAAVLPDEGAPGTEADKASEALDAWLKSQPQRFIIPKQEA